MATIPPTPNSPFRSAAQQPARAIANPFLNAAPAIQSSPVNSVQPSISAPVAGPVLTGIVPSTVTPAAVQETGPAEMMGKWIILEEMPGQRTPYLKQKARLYRDVQNNQSILLLLGVKPGSMRWNQSIEILGFTPTPRGRFLFKPVLSGDKIRVSDYRKVWPGAYGDEIP